jgi:hypothetical protein
MLGFKWGKTVGVGIKFDRPNTSVLISTLLNTKIKRVNTD